MAAGLPLPSIDENISTTLSSGITDVAGSMDVQDATKIPGVTYAVIDRVDSAGTLKATSLWEYVKITNVAGQTCTITRGQGGSTAQAHGSGAVVELVATSSMFEDWYAALNPEHTATGGHVIVGTMTVAGMNLLSVATIAVAGIGTLTAPIINVQTYLNASGASIIGNFPASIFPSGASGSVLTSNGNTTAVMAPIPSTVISSKVFSFTHDVSVTGLQTIGGIGFTPTSIHVGFGGISSNQTSGTGRSDSTGAANAAMLTSAGVSDTDNVLVYVSPSGGTNALASIVNYYADGFTLNWSKAGSPAGTLTVKGVAYK